MKILEISFEEPSDFSGGGIGIKQSLLSLMKLGDIDYIGPGFDINLFSDKKNIHIIKELYHDNNIFSRIISTLKGGINGYYKSWAEIEKDIDWSQYDLIHIEFTKYPFLIKIAQKKGIPTLVRMHNIEADYYYNIYKNKKNVKNYFQYWFYHMSERKAVNIANKIVCLTQCDLERAKELYTAADAIFYINPVCIVDEGKHSRNNSKIILMTGSLWYGPNADGVKWFIKEVWPEIYKYDKEIRLIVSGSNPENEIQRICNDNNIELVANPKEIAPFFKRASVYVAPVFSGAGMKVKVAEALMYGLPVVASLHALMGYDISNIDSVIGCKTAGDFSRAIIKIIKLCDEEYERLCYSSRILYENKYSIDSSVKFYQNLIQKFD